MSAPDAIEVDLLKLLFGQATTIFTSTPLGNVWLRLMSANGSDSANGTEISNADYGAIDIKSLMGTPASGQIANTSIIDFGTATVDWANIVGWETWTGETTGTRILRGALTTPKDPAIGDPISFPVGAFVVTLD